MKFTDKVNFNLGAIIVLGFLCALVPITHKIAENSVVLPEPQIPDSLTPEQVKIVRDHLPLLVFRPSPPPSPDDSIICPQLSVEALGLKVASIMSDNPRAKMKRSECDNYNDSLLKQAGWHLRKK